MAFDSKLDSFKTAINLAEYAGACGYALVRHESSRNSAVMKSESGDKIVVARNANGHWMYFSVRDGKDNGTIIDFVLRRRAANNLGRVKQELSGWLGGTVLREERQRAARPDLVPSSKDIQQVIRRFSTMRAVDEHGYLASRGLGRDVTGDARFAGRVFLDDRRNAVFPHQSDDGLCGYEIKNRGFTGFSAGGEKGLWQSNRLEGDRAVILAESAIDAMSYFAVTRRAGVFLSTAGAWNPKTPALIQATIESLPPASEVVLAFDNDDQGHRYVDQAMALLAGKGLWIEVDLPLRRGEDWNDQLRRLRGDVPAEHVHNPARKGEGRGE